jgi:O-acetyl-ADP-ribose deacetylase (regulator of RNase III)
MTKIKYVEGDIFKSNYKLLTHGCNDRGGWGSGFVLPLTQYHPEAKEAYLKKHSEGKLVGGSIIPARSNGKTILNMITQSGYGRDGERYVKYDWIAEGFTRINYACSQYEEIYMPLIGAGLGGGKWSIISSIIETECVDIQPIVYYLKGQQP